MTEHIPAPTLAEHVRTEGPLTGAALVAFAAGLAQAVAAMHRTGVVHRDLNAANVVVTPEGPKLADSTPSPGGEPTASVRAEATVGTSSWMAPEQARGLPAGPTADVFAWAAVVAYAASGVAPFGEGRPEAVLYRIVHEDPRVPPLPAPLDRLVAAALAKDPSQRPDAAALVAALTGRDEPTAEPAGHGTAEVALTELPPPVRVPAAPAEPVLGRATSSAEEEPPSPNRPRARNPVAVMLITAVSVALATAWVLGAWSGPAAQEAKDDLMAPEQGTAEEAATAEDADAVEEADTAATVNGDTVAVSEVEERFETFSQNPQVEQRLANDEDGQLVAQMEAEILTGLIRSRLIEQGAAEMGVDVVEGDIEQQRAEVVEQVGGGEQYEAILEQNNLSEEEVGEQLREVALQEAIARELTVEADVDGAEVADHLEAYATASASHILLDSEDEAGYVLAELEDGRDFGELAREYSIDPSVEGNGGDLGEFSRGDMVPEFSEAVFAAEAGDLVGPVKSDFGWHVIEVHSVDAGPSMTQAADEIRDDLLEEERSQAVQEWLTERANQARVDVTPRFGEWDPEAGQVTPATVAAPGETSSEESCRDADLARLRSLQTESRQLQSRLFELQREFTGAQGSDLVDHPAFQESSQVQAKKQAVDRERRTLAELCR